MRVGIRTKEFCYLATSPVWLGWLQKNHKDLYNELIDHLNNRSKCSANRKKMKEILARIGKNKQQTKQLISFLRKYFPYIVEQDREVASETSQEANRHNVFSHYDPSLLTYPRRVIISKPNADLESEAREWCKNQAFCDFIVVDDRVYIEYLPPGQGMLRDRIPKSNWEIESYRRRNGGIGKR